MLAFGSPDEIRVVDLDDFDPSTPMSETLDEVYRLGQNDFQPKPHPSVSSGDVIKFGIYNYLCCRVGFRRLTDDELKDYTALPRLDRHFSDLLDQPNVD